MGVCLPLCVNFLLTFFAVVSTELFVFCLLCQGLFISVNISAFPAINAVSVLSRAVNCVWNLFMVSFPIQTFLLYVLRRAPLWRLGLRFSLERLSPPPQVQKFMPHFFPCAFIDSLCSEFWSRWNLSLCGCEMDCPFYCVQDSRFFTRLFLNFLCCFIATAVAIITIIKLGAILVPSTRGWGISLSSSSEKLCWVFDCCYIELIYWWLCLFTGHQK